MNLVQRVDGVEVFNSDTTGAVNARNEVIAIAGQFFHGAAASAATRSSARSRAAGARGGAEEAPSSVEDAIARAAFDLTNVAYARIDFVRGADQPDAGQYRFYDYTSTAGDRRPVFERPVRVKDVMFPLGDGQFVSAYYMELWIKGFPAFSYVMDAVDTPDLLYRKNLTSHATFKYRVHNTGDALFRPLDGPAPGTPHPTGVPNGFQAPTVAEKLIMIESLLAGDPWLPPGATTTDGNNCTAYADLAPPSGFGPGDVMGMVSSPSVFDYTYDHNKPSTDADNLQNSLVGMFFHVNWLHDRWYEAGFDEASGNAQKSNFGRGGRAGDPVLAEGSDVSGTDNANMSTPADGNSPRMQMFTFTGTDRHPDQQPRSAHHVPRDGALHYEPAGRQCQRPHQRAGGSDGRRMGRLLRVCMTSQATDDFAEGTFAVGGWTDLAPGFNDNYYFSIRRYPYSADMTKNPLTFKHIGNNVVLPVGPPIQSSPAGNNEVHNAGEVWCYRALGGVRQPRREARARGRRKAYAVVRDWWTQTDANPADVHSGPRRNHCGRFCARPTDLARHQGRLRKTRHGRRRRVAAFEFDVTGGSRRKFHTLSTAFHTYGDVFGRRGARIARREERECRAHVTDEQRREAGCPGGRDDTVIVERRTKVMTIYTHDRALHRSAAQASARRRSCRLWRRACRGYASATRRSCTPKTTTRRRRKASQRSSRGARYPRRDVDATLEQLHIVVQHGRRFQQQHPTVPVLHDRGRFLLVQMDAEQARESGRQRRCATG